MTYHVVADAKIVAEWLRSVGVAGLPQKAKLTKAGISMSGDNLILDFETRGPKGFVMENRLAKPMRQRPR